MAQLITPDIKKILSIFVIWRILLFLIAGISSLIIPQFGAKFPYFNERLASSGLPHFIWSFGNFDGVHYLGIAKDGYAYQYTQAFFPIYPLLIRLVSSIIFGESIIAALLISNFSFLAGLIIFYKLLKKTHKEKVAFWSCLFLLAFPTSYYFGAVYTEGLFFLMIIGTFSLLESNKILEASFIGSFASATRLIGVFLAPALMVKKNVKPIIPLLLTPLGLLVYTIYLKFAFNNFFYFLTSQAIWGQERSTAGIVLLPQVLYRYLKILATTSGLPFINAAFELAATIFAIAILVYAFKRIRLEWLIFSLFAVLTPTLTGTLASMPRYVLVAFPIFVVLGSIRSSVIKISLFVVFIILLIASTTLFTQGYWVA